jgi:hypothetical protein
LTCNPKFYIVPHNLSSTEKSAYHSDAQIKIMTRQVVEKEQ